MPLDSGESSEMCIRDRPTVLEFQKRFGYVPLIAVFSFAALLQFYRGDLIMEGKIRAYREGTPYYVCDSEDILGFRCV